MTVVRVRARPLSATAVVAAAAVVIFETVQIARGELYLRVLDSPDGTTLIMVSCLVIAGTLALRRHTDAQAVSVAFVAALSCVFAYEAIYKWSFYLAPFGRDMPPDELREFVLQVAVAATLWTGFAHHAIAATRWTAVWSAVFGALWILWLVIGFPQLDGHDALPPLLSWELDYTGVYLLNRTTKLVLFVVYLTLFPSSRDRAGSSAAPVAT